MGELSPISIPPLSAKVQVAGARSSSTEQTGPSFTQVLKTSLERMAEVQQEADQAIQAFVLGRSDDLVETLLAVEKARLAFQTLVQVRNKLLEAYQEIMRMPV